MKKSSRSKADNDIWNDDYGATGDDLYDALNYTGMVRAVRKLALEEKLASPEELATMTTLEICNLVVDKYDILSKEGERVILVERTKMDQVKSMVKMLNR